MRRLLDILAWYTSTGSGALSGDAPRLAPAVASKAEFLAVLILEDDGGQIPELLREDCRVVSYDHFMDPR